MATSVGRVYLNGCNYELAYDLLSQSVANNTSTVRLYGILHVTNNYISWSSGSASVHVSGLQAIGTYYSRGDYTVITRDFTWSHDNNGNFSAYVGASLSTTFVSGDTGGIITLPRINRVTKINSFTGNDVEGTFSATYTKYISDWKEKLRISIPNVVALMTIDNYESGDGVTLDSASITTIQNYMNTNGTNQVVLGGVIETWNGNTKVGESSEINNICTFINAEPTFTYTTTETNSNVVDLLGATSNTVIQNVSNLRINTTPTAYKGASISKVAITHGNQTYTDIESPYSVEVPVTTNSFTITTTDNRTNSTSQTFTKTMIEYQPVDITSLTMKRQNPTSSNIILNLEAKYYQKTFGSTANVPTVKWKLDNGAYTTIPSSEYTIDTENNKLKIYNYTLSNALVYTANGTFAIEISDLLTTDADARDVLKGVATYDAGEHDLKVNGDLFIADTNGENAINVKDFIDNIGYEYSLNDEVDNISAWSKTNIGYISLPAGKYIGSLWVRNQGGGNNIYNTRVYFDDDNNTDELSNFVSNDWSIGIVPIILTVSSTSTYYARVMHSGSTHKIDIRLNLFKIK